MLILLTASKYAVAKPQYLKLCDFPNHHHLYSFPINPITDIYHEDVKIVTLAKHPITKIRYNIVIFKCQVMWNKSISHHYLSRYIKQPYNNSQQRLFLIPVIAIMNCGDKSIKLPKLKRQMQNMYGCLLYLKKFLQDIK